MNCEHVYPRVYFHWPLKRCFILYCSYFRMWKSCNFWKSYDSLIFVYIAWIVYIAIVYQQSNTMLPEEDASNYKPHFTLFRQILMKTFCSKSYFQVKLIFYLVLKKGLTEWMPQLVLSVNKKFCTWYNTILTTFSTTLM